MFRAVPVAVALILALALPGCNPARVAAEADYRGPALPRPGRVLVRDFAVLPQEVRLDQGVRARLTRMAEDEPLDAQRMQVAREASSRLADTLAQSLRGYGIPAERRAGPLDAGEGREVLVEGQIVALDEGNSTRRTLVGFGAGKSSFAADAQLFYRERGQPPRLLETLEGDADSGHAPGAAGTMGAGAVAGSSAAASAAASLGLHTGSERRAASPDDLARKTAEGLAARIAGYFAAQGWLPPGAGR